jgi:molybdopterin converting factor subunit 1
MRVEVHYFAAFREAAGTDVEQVETDATTPEALFAECAERRPGLQRYSASLVAVNDEMSSWQAPLAAGDRVLFFPPVAGG